MKLFFFSLLAPGAPSGEQPCLILHCAYGVSGESNALFCTIGTGKTTQAGLWEQYRGSRTVNGDKALLEYDNTAWTANGWPVCRGTSGVCETKSSRSDAL